MSSITGGRHGHGRSHSRFSKFVSLVSGRPRVSTVGTFIYYGALISAMYRRAGGPYQGRNNYPDFLPMVTPKIGDITQCDTKLISDFFRQTRLRICSPFYDQWSEGQK